MSLRPRDPSVGDDAVALEGDRTGCPFPIVGVGASAGGLEAFSQLFAHLPDLPGMALVLVQHLDPKHESQLVGLLSKVSRMPVIGVTDGLEVHPNHVYVIPSNTTMTIRQGILRLVPRGRERGAHLPIDQFFKSLADDRGAGAIGVVLSGTGADGTLGLAEIKAAGGITFAQDRASARFDGMPESAINSGAVDSVLSPEELARELICVGRHPYVVHSPIDGLSPPDAADEEHFRTILSLLRSGFGVDFTHYRDATIRRRTMRRMALHSKGTFAEYAEQLQGDRLELHALYHDILINVTSFFRDPEMFEALKRSVFPEILKARSPQSPIRIWAAGCSTGQEAYSLAMTLLESLDGRPTRPPIQIFATDLGDTVCLERARAGLYPESIETEVSPERLARFFTKEDVLYRINKEIRELCVFAKHNLVSDPPFSRVDLISCRNVLIYLAPALQKRLIPTFHYALNPAGFLMLGASETLGGFADQFSVFDKTHKFYARTASAPRPYPHFNADASHSSFRRDTVGEAPAAATPADLQREADRIVLSQHAPAGVLVNETLDILQFRGRTSPYLEPAPGTASLNLLKMAREGMLVDLSEAIAEVRKEGVTVQREGVRVRDGSQVRDVTLKVVPVGLPGLDVRCFLVLFEEARAPLGRDAVGTGSGEGRRPRLTLPAGGVSAWAGRLFGAGRPDDGRNGPGPAHDDPERELVQLRRELAATREQLQLAAEQHDSANDALKSANEEILSSNEELQSTNEELETAKEELQSVNQELTTVNEQLQSRNLELSQSNNDLSNLIGSTTIPIIMLGSDLRIRRFTPTAAKVLNLHPADVGRSIGDIRPSVDVPDLGGALAEVIEKVRVAERAGRDRDGRWYQVRLHPYKTPNDKIDGAVIVLHDVDEAKRAQARLKEAGEFTQAIVDTVREPILILASDLSVASANRSYHRTFPATPEKIWGRPFFELLDGQWNVPGLRKMLEEILSAEQSFDDFEVAPVVPGVGRRVMLLSARKLRQQDATSDRILVAFEDITERRRAEDALREADRRKNEFLAMLGHELRNPLAAIDGALQITELEPDPAIAVWSKEVIKRQVKNLAHLVDDLLDVSRITQGKVQLRSEPLELAPTVLRAIEAAKLHFDDRKHEVTVSLPEGPIWLFADPARLEQILANLLNNASKYTDPGGQIGVEVERQGSAAAITVRDNGVGISREMLPRVFDLFAQSERSIDRAQGGLGIGLTLVRSLVEMHGGSITASSAVGEGSAFTVRLPTVDAPPAPAAEPPSVASHARPQRVLVVDDNADTANGIAFLLDRAGHDVRTAYDGNAAIEIARSFRPEALLVDIGLPGMDGYQVAEVLRNDDSCARSLFIAVTGYGEESAKGRSAKAGFRHHLTKPVNQDTLAYLLGSPAAAPPGRS